MADIQNDTPIAKGSEQKAVSDLTSNNFLDEVHKQCELKGGSRLLTQTTEVLKDVIYWGAIGAVLGEGAGVIPGAAIGVGMGLWDASSAVAKEEASCRANLMEKAIKKQQGEKK